MHARLCALVGGAFFSTAAHAATINVYTSRATFDAVTTTMVFEDFEGVDSSLVNVRLPTFSRYGATYTPFAGEMGFNNVDVTGSPLLYTNFGADIPIVGGTQLTSHVLATSGNEDIRADFATGHTALGFDAYYNGLGPLSVTLYGAGGAVLGVYTNDGFNPTSAKADIGYLGFTSDEAIYGFRWTSSNGFALNTAFDNISLGAVNGGVPEPATWALMMGGFGAAGSVLRRRRIARA